MFNSTKHVEKMKKEQAAWLQRQRAEQFQQALAVLEERRPPHQFHFPMPANPPLHSWEHLHAQGLLSPRVQPLPVPRQVLMHRPLWTRVRRWPHTSMMFFYRPDTAATVLRQGVIAGDTMPVTPTPLVGEVILEELIDTFHAATT